MTTPRVDGRDRYFEIKHRFGAAEIVKLAEAEGLHHRRSGAKRSECPGCRDGDPRGASLGDHDGVGVWKCQRDDHHSGTAIDYLAFARDIEPFEALGELERIAGIDPRGQGLPPPGPRKPPAPPTYPPTAEVTALWESCAPLGLDAEVSEAWAERKIGIDHVEDRELGRALPPGHTVPRWAWGAGQPWSAGQHRLIVPMYDAHGNLASLHARAELAPIPWTPGLCRQLPAAPVGFGFVRAPVLVA